jgi:D-alanine-D-alanine ligase
MKVAVLLGGTSAERDVSIASGSQVIKALRSRGHEVSAVDPAVGLLDDMEERRMLETGVATEPPGGAMLAKMSHAPLLRLTTSGGLNGFDVMFMGLHGGSGEDGKIQAVLELADLPFTGSSHLSSAMAMDKDLSKRLFQRADISTAPWFMMPCDLDEAVRELGFPLVVKANKQGSTVGLTVVKERDQLKDAIAEAYEHDDEVLLEKFISGREITVGILGDQALAVGEIIPQLSDIFDYQSKYQEGGALEIFPANLPTTITAQIQALGLAVHRALKLQGYSRVDFRLDADERPYCLEANTLPGLTAASLMPKSAAAEGIGFAELCERICTLAVERHRT